MDKKKSFLWVAAFALGSVVYNAFKPIKSKLPVKEGMDLNRFLGSWYIIAEKASFFEDKLDNKCFEFTADGSKINAAKTGTTWAQDKKVLTGHLNRREGYSESSLLLKLGERFSSGFNIMHTDESYNFALIFGDNLDQLWILSRTAQLPQEIQDMYVEYARKSGYDLNQIS